MKKRLSFPVSFNSVKNFTSPKKMFKSLMHLVILFLVAIPALSQKPVDPVSVKVNNNGSKITQYPNGIFKMTPVAFGITSPVRDLPIAAEKINGKRRTYITREQRMEKIRAQQLREKGISEEEIEMDEINRQNAERVKKILPDAGAGQGSFTDPLVNPKRTNAPLIVGMPAPSLTFDGASQVDNAAQGIGAVLPPDVNGDVGLNHYVSSVNLVYKIFNKNGTVAAGPFKTSDLFSGLPAGDPCRTHNDGDPVVVYDPLADRWHISQFAITGTTNCQCAAVSVTGDPTGSYYVWRYNYPNNLFNDYPKVGVWPDAYHMTFNQFNNAGTQFLGLGILSQDRPRALAGDPATSVVYTNIATIDPSAGGALPADVDGYVAPPAGMAEVIAEFRSDEFGDPNDAIRYYKWIPNFVTPASSSITVLPDVILAPFDARAPATRLANEVSGGANLDAISDRMMHRFAYRNLGTQAAPVNSFVGNFSVNVSGVNPTSAATFQTGIRWFEMRRTGDAFSVFDQGTHNLTPGNGASGLNNWMGSIAQDNKGNLALGFSQSSTTQRADIKIAGRTNNVANSGVLNLGEALFFAATGSQTSTSGRWGDYSSMNVDPIDDCTFWYTQEYYAATSSSGWSTRVGKFILPTCTPAPKATIQGTITVCASGNPVNQALVEATGGFSRTTGAPGTYSMTVSPGTYTISASKGTGFTSGSAAPVTVVDGQTATVNLCLSGVPVLIATTATLVSESCLPANGVIDPGETVTVAFGVQNTGAANTTNDVGTLQSGGGVTSPGAPQNYGVIVAGGPSVSREFTFTADPVIPCGSNITATISHMDGVTNLGNLIYTLPTGLPNVTTVFAESFDGVIAPALPVGWTTSHTGVEVDWVTSTTNPNSAPNDAFAPDVTNIGNTELITPSINVPSQGGKLTFRNLYNMESTFDGMVLEISINGGAYTDITSGGNAFVIGGYNGAINTAFGSPIAGRNAWTGLSGGTTAAPTYINSTINLPAAANGQAIQLKWRAAADNSVIAAGAAGVRIDNISITNTSYICCAPLPPNFYVNDNSTSGDVYTTAIGNDANPGTPSAPFATIAHAISVAQPGNTIFVDAGTFNESVNISKSLNLKGVKADICAPTRTGAETIVNCVNGTGVNASNVTINGFTIQGQTTSSTAPGFGYAVYMAPPNTGTQLINNIIKNNVVGSSLSNAGASPAQVLIKCNWFDTNNQAGPASGAGIYTDEFTAGGAVSNVLIDSNKFSGNLDAGIDFSTSDPAKALTGVTISNNQFNANNRAAFLYNTISSTFSRNTVSNSTGAGSGDVRIYGGVNNFSILNNSFTNGAPSGVRITNDGGSSNNSNITVHENSFVGYTKAIQLVSGYTGPLDATCNWYGSSSTAVITPQIEGSVTYVPFLTNGTDNEPATPGFQPVPGSCNGSLICVSPAAEAYSSNTQTGNQAHEGELGMQFLVNAPGGIMINQIGAFDDGGNGITGFQPGPGGGVRVAIFNRATKTIVPGLDVTIIGFGDAYIGYHQMKNITPVNLPPGDYEIVAKGYSAAERNGNAGLGGGPYPTDNGGGAITFGTEFAYGKDDHHGFNYPAFTGIGTTHEFLAGTFNFTTVIPCGGPSNCESPAAQAYVSNTQTGNQAHRGELGMEFLVNNPSGIIVKQLGAFDDLGNGITGLQPGGGVRVAIFNRSTHNIVPGLDVTVTGLGDAYTGNHRMKNITPVTLPPGDYVVVAKGYHSGERNGNAGNGGGPYPIGDDGGGAITFANESTYGPDDPNGFSYPGTAVDFGTSHEFLAGTFSFTKVIPCSAANANLSNLVLSQGTLVPAFASGITSYTASVANSITSITVTPTASAAGATITVNGTPVASGSPSGPIALAVGSNIITTVVTAQDGTTMKTYTVNVTRSADCESAPVQAYTSNTQTGNQAHRGELGMQFIVNNSSGVIIKQLGAFDDLGNGITGLQPGGGVRVAIFNRATHVIVPGLDVTISGAADAYTGNHRMKNISPVTLPPGDYVIVAKGYNSGERNGNAGLPGGPYPPGNTNGGAITFGNESSYGPDDPNGFNYPVIAANFGDSHEYLAGTFNYTVNVNCPIANTATVSTIGSGNKVSEQTLIVKAKDLQVYPNPTTGQFNLQLVDVSGSNINIQVINSNGKVVEQRSIKGTTKITSSVIPFNLVNQPSGTYLIKVESAKGIQTKKFVIQR